VPSIRHTFLPMALTIGRLPVYALAGCLVWPLSTGVAMAQQQDANYDEARVPAYVLPDPLKLASGQPVKDAATWRNQRRAELLRLFEDNVYGRSPSRPPGMRFERVEIDPKALGGRATRKQVRILLDGQTTGPSIELLIYLPNGRSRPSPIFLGLNFGGNHTVHADPAIRLSTRWIATSEGAVDHRATEAGRGRDAQSWPVETILSRGYALATAYYGDLEPDHPEGWKDGVRSRFGPGAKGSFGPGDWGAIGAWAFGLQRIVDYLETDHDVDAKRIALFGHSRLGKTALWAGAQDERFALVVSNESGEGGAALARRHFGETTAAITKSFPHWFAGRLKDYADREDQLPVDQHTLLALIAPRPLYVASAEEDLWADPRGEFLSAKAADPVYRLLGKEGLGVADMPKVEVPVGSTVGYHVRRGKHGVTAYDWEQYLAFAERHLPGR
jgi:(4-O-methyl)-D-glucuronate---lignin esterase